MRILFNTYPVAFDCPGGGEIQLLQLRSALERAGLEVVLYDPWQPKFAELDLVHYFSVQSGSMNFCHYATRRGLPLVISSSLWVTDENCQQYPLDEIRALLHLCDLVITNSSAESQQLSHFFELAQDRFAVVHNGVNKAFAQHVSPDLFRTHFGITEPFVLNVANIEPRKNQLRLIQAVKRLDMNLVILGNIRDQAYFDKCRQEAGSRLLYLGYVDHNDDLLKSAYRACEAFVLPSLTETPGLAALEAAACGAKIVVTQVGCAKEYFQDLVDYTDPLNVGDITQAIHNQLNGDGSAGLADHVLDSFSWDSAARELADAYRLVLARKADKENQS